MRAQRGGFVMGLIIGLLLGLGLALAVALYVTKAPVPFVNKVQQRTPEQDAAEAERNKNWDPNAPLANKPAARASAPATATPTPAVPPPKASATAEPAKSTRDPAAILSGKEPAPIAIAPQSAKPGPDPFIYFVQVGAFSKPEEAEQQRAKLAMLGYTAKVTEREQQGRTMYRVRLGPYQAKDEAESTQAKLQSGGDTAALVRVER
ncbi:MAG TPA: SPOR domain-containing protein [Burkholderiaceae bacterium]|nr:SPOR domain-containing protein [Burkholderiaceae bacterium]